MSPGWTRSGFAGLNSRVLAPVGSRTLICLLVRMEMGSGQALVVLRGGGTTGIFLSPV